MFIEVSILAAILCIAHACIPSNQYYPKICIQCEECTEDITTARETYQNYSISVYNEIEELKNTLKPQIQDVVDQLNIEISNGPKACNKYAIRDCTSYVVQILKNCRGVVEYANKLSMSDELMSYQVRLEHNEILDEEELSDFCTYYVANTNKMCSILQENLNAVNNCNIEEAVDKTFREPWLNCVVLNSED